MLLLIPDISDMNSKVKEVMSQALDTYTYRCGGFWLSKLVEYRRKEWVHVQGSAVVSYSSLEACMATARDII